MSARMVDNDNIALTHTAAPKASASQESVTRLKCWLHAVSCDRDWEKDEAAQNCSADAERNQHAALGHGSRSAGLGGTVMAWAPRSDEYRPLDTESCIWVPDSAI